MRKVDQVVVFYFFHFRSKGIPLLTLYHVPAPTRFLGFVCSIRLPAKQVSTPATVAAGAVSTLAVTGVIATTVSTLLGSTAAGVPPGVQVSQPFRSRRSMRTNKLEILMITATTRSANVEAFRLSPLSVAIRLEEFHFRNL